MDPIRKARLESLMIEELTLLINGGIKDPRVGQVTITKIELTPDAKEAKIYFVPFGVSADPESDESRETADDCLEGLRNSKGFLKRQLGPILKTRNIPDLFFKEDLGYYNTSRVNELLKQIDSEKAREPDNE